MPSIGGSSSNSNQSQSGTSAGNAITNQNTTMASSGGATSTPINSAQIQAALNGVGNNPLTGAAQGQSQSGANYANSIASAGSGAMNNFLNGSYLNSQNPYFTGAVTSQIQNLVPQLSSQFEGSGRYGSGAQNNANSSAIANAVGTAANANYQQNLGNTLTAAGQVPSYVSASGIPGQNLMNAALAPGQSYIQDLSAVSPGQTSTQTNNSNINQSGTQSTTGQNASSGSSDTSGMQAGFSA